MRNQAYFWATHGGAELDLLLFKDGKRTGVACKWVDAPRLTPSMQSTLADLHLDLEFYPQNWVWQVEAEACAHRLFVCLDERLHAATIAGAEQISNGLFICLDTALSDEEKLRLADQCRLKVI